MPVKLKKTNCHRKYYCICNIKTISPKDNEDIATEVNKHTIATGPVAKYLEEPKNAATATGSNAAYKP